MTSQKKGSAKRKVNKWKIWFIILSAINIFVFGFPILLLAGSLLPGAANAGYTMVAFFMIISALMVGWGVALINVISLSMYIYSQSPKGSCALLSYIFVSLSALYVIFAGAFIWLR